jgi:hypothetical protein
MGNPIPRASPPISLATQHGHLLRRYPNSKIVRLHERLVWLGTLTPADYTASYEVLIDHQIGKSPLIYVARPRLQLLEGQALPHVYPLNTLCLFLGDREWHQSIPIADTLVPWASEWLLFYELWLATGEWLGEGEHPPPGPVNRRARRRSGRQDASRLTRLTSALQLVNSGPAGLHELLFNARWDRQFEALTRCSARRSTPLFTRHWVAEVTLDLVGCTAESDLGGVRLVGPACGNGAFLIPAVERLVRSLLAFICADGGGATSAARVRHHDQVAAVADRVDHRVGVLRQPGRVVLVGQVGCDHVVATGAQLGGQQAPVPGGVPAAVDQHVAGHGYYRSATALKNV